MIQYRFDIYMMNVSSKYVRLTRMNELTKRTVSVNKCLMLMGDYLDVMIDNAYEYYYEDGSGIIRKTPTGYLVYAYHDIDNIDHAAIKCIKIIDKHTKLK